ncbi:type I-E CRISPR-associated protein Cas6/Cse3/CasE [Micromonospora sp. HUAS LYJ1]|uniref:type I-E CRISPR-associated protein Cas6/Cse3/CasE n=1 Tax=Micromonospora sp. HUAS LYJ1 TaxID=3061626 RepID=UPI002673CDD0|nr:type I-E CRISPR-associated protein Cas6/Cse3/CasE [Micromonospora sp. HUAS LYJ1]WKU03502.1 type I-E CRISPR-associated protein Cas6/Cse3/CasE [Micromonospora sp. HUAS LYJ1]
MTAWLTRIAPDLRHPAARHDLRDITAVHRRVMSLLPDDLGEQPRHQAGALFRLDHTTTGPALLIQTTMPPDPSRLPDGYGTVQTRDITPLLTALTSGMTVHYRIAANASKRAWKGDNAGKVVALSGPQAEQWWQRKAEASGLHLHNLHAEPQPAAVGRATPVRHAITRFDGQAVITDPDQARTAILSGIGRGRSFGCGLLSLAPTR